MGPPEHYFTFNYQAYKVDIHYLKALSYNLKSFALLLTGQELPNILFA
jgi:hypothetical protein